MTPKQRQQKIKTIEAMLKAAGFIQDHYGNWKNTINQQEYRVKIKKVNTRIEYKDSKRWIKVVSKPTSKLDIGGVSGWLTQFQTI